MAIIAPKTDSLASAIWPELDDAALDRIRVDDVTDIDYLYVFLHGEPLPAVWDPVGDGDASIGFRSENDDDSTDEVIGIMVGQFRQSVLSRHPDWERVTTTTDGARRVALRQMIADVAEMLLAESGAP